MENSSCVLHAFIALKIGTHGRACTAGFLDGFGMRRIKSGTPGRNCTGFLVCERVESAAGKAISMRCRVQTA